MLKLETALFCGPDPLKKCVALQEHAYFDGVLTGQLALDGDTDIGHLTELK